MNLRPPLPFGRYVQETRDDEGRLPALERPLLPNGRPAGYGSFPADHESLAPLRSARPLTLDHTRSTLMVLMGLDNVTLVL